MLISVKLLTRYVTLRYVRFGTRKVRCLNISRFKVAPKTKFPAGPGVKNG